MKWFLKMVMLDQLGRLLRTIAMRARNMQVELRLLAWRRQVIEVKARNRRKRSDDAHSQPQRCRVHRRSHTTRPPIVLTEVGAMSALKHLAGNGLIAATVDDAGACLSFIWITHS